MPRGKLASDLGLPLAFDRAAQTPLHRQRCEQFRYMGSSRNGPMCLSQLLLNVAIATIDAYMCLSQLTLNAIIAVHLLS
jgi:hypothetical protein